MAHELGIIRNVVTNQRYNRLQEQIDGEVAS